MPRLCFYHHPQYGYWYARCFATIKQALKNAVYEVWHKRLGELIGHRTSQRHFGVKHRVLIIYQCFTENRNKPNIIIANAFWTFLSLCREVLGIKTEMSFKKLSGCYLFWKLLACMLSHLLEIKIEMCSAAFQIFSSCLNHTVAPQMKAATFMQANFSLF